MPRFRLRWLMVGLVVWSLLAAGVAVEVRRSRQQRAALDWLAKRGWSAQVTAGWVPTTFCATELSRDCRLSLSSKGRYVFDSGEDQADLDPEEVEVLARLKGLRRIAIYSGTVAPEVARGFSRLVSVETLSFEFCEIDDEALCELREMPALREVHLTATNVTDTGINALSDARPDVQVWDD